MLRSVDFANMVTPVILFGFLFVILWCSSGEPTSPFLSWYHCSELHCCSLCLQVAYIPLWLVE